MNIFEIIFFAAMSAGVVFIANLIADRWTAYGWLLVVPVVYFWARLIVGTAKSLFMRVNESGRSRPVCRKGRCQSKDYTLIDPSISHMVFRCRCGDKYLSQGTYFSHITPAGTMQPYMVQERNGQWKRDPHAPQ